VTFVVDNLERRGWVRRERVEDDRRRFLIRLTPVGKQLIKRAFPRHVKTVAREFARLELKEQETMRRLCRKLGRGDSGKSPQKSLKKSAERRKEKNHDTSSTR
jgi:MarR family transcriptional regulator, 2-MHQ and catechol-resistance regulon repressor